MNKYLISIIATLTYIAVLIGVYSFHAHFLRVDVVFYAALVDAFVAVFIVGGALLFSRIVSVLSTLEKAQLVIIWLLGGYAFAISVPTVVDRSLSFYILEKLQQRGGSIAQDHMEDVFTREYMKEHRLIDVRLTEQLESGTIVIQNGCVQLTEKGETIASLSRYLRQNWLPKQRLLMGEYSDALTDPFRKSAVPDYSRCDGK
jgi:hypothetical protein